MEQTAEGSHPSLRPHCSAAFLLEGEADDRLALVMEVHGAYIRDLDPDETIGAVRAAVAREHGLHARVVFLAKGGSIPKTSSGKVRRLACRNRLQRGELKLVDAADPGLARAARST